MIVTHIADHTMDDIYYEVDDDPRTYLVHNPWTGTYEEFASRREAVRVAESYGNEDLIMINDVGDVWRYNFKNDTFEWE